MVYGNQNWVTYLRGVSTQYLEIRDWQPSSGRNFFEREIDGSAKVCVLGAPVAENLFGGEDRSERSSGSSAPLCGDRRHRTEGPVHRRADQDDVVFLPSRP